MKVDIYWNLHKDTFSVRHKGKVIKYSDKITLTDVEFIVQESGRKRVLKEKRKNVHAFVRGYISKFKKRLDAEVGYNPYKSPYFYIKNKGKPIYKSNICTLENINGKPVVTVCQNN